ncbi:epithelial membrane protein 3 [Protopterus annectens]|uniref:epithelial membrane protein 3 n=1 Tax=Protopterus annectens TaxID=7888 RepID=UPI001CFB9657|nr:epithelial membrane protein 3 [Protopterus annectens]XP_043936479.1 epithelial membrane protein 3 [Protopterus annectens]
MSFLLITVTGLHLIALVILFIATLDKTWWVNNDQKGDLWYKCFYENHTDAWTCESATDNEWLHAIQALMILAVLFCTVSLVLFLCQLYALKQGGLFYATGIFQIFASLAVLTGVVIYTVHVAEIQKNPNGHFGHCFYLAWVAFPLTMVSGIMYIHLRKLE